MRIDQGFLILTCICGNAFENTLKMQEYCSVPGFRNGRVYEEALGSITS